MGLFGGAKKPKVLFVATEAKPFASVGGLGAVMYSLPKALRKIGYDARVMIPRYLPIEDTHELPIRMEYEGLEVPTGNHEGEQYMRCNVKRYDSDEEPGKPVTTYFLENMEYYEQRANIYGYADDPVRWALLCRGVLEFLRMSQWRPDVIICADWQTGYLPNYLKTVYAHDRRLSGITTIFSIHNLVYQGMFNHRFVKESEYDDGHSPIPAFNDPRLLQINGLRRGIMNADVINTVSPTYAKEIMTEEFGEGLETLLAERRSAVYGILNGIDYKLWDPEHDPLLEHPFSQREVDKRAPNKALLQQRFGLPVRDDAFVAAIVSRLTQQKGLDLVEEAIEPLLQELPMQLIVLGEGEDKYMRFFQELQKKFPEQVSTELKFDPAMPHQVFAGADAVLVPSLFEPCGLTQMEAMRYGAIPIVRKTGGLADTVVDATASEEGTGFVFEKYMSASLLVAVVRAYENFRNKDFWKQLQQRAMGKNFSWEMSARKYDKMIEKALKARETHAGAQE
ncbi:MAG TPA: glycogen/starch synthase [Candidatus Paceibacterota bacterium]|nr:glycogen/starch synthase [Candidatus Paceibacterota bacterium]